MKKLLVLALVLSMATIANAGLTITMSGTTALAQGAVGTYVVGYSWSGMPSTGLETLVGADVDITSTMGTIGGGIFLTTNIDTSVVSFFGTNSSTGNYEAALMNDVGDSDMGSPLFSFTLTAPMANGTATINLLENAFLDTAWSQITGMDLDALPAKNVQIGVPEPITMTLLGLGGLFLRRRK